MEKEIEKCTNYLGGLWFRIHVSKEITTEIDIFVGIKEFSFQDSLVLPEPQEEIEEIQLFESKQVKY